MDVGNGFWGSPVWVSFQVLLGCRFVLVCGNPFECTFRVMWSPCRFHLGQVLATYDQFRIVTKESVILYERKKYI